MARVTSLNRTGRIFSIGGRRGPPARTMRIACSSRASGRSSSVHSGSTPFGRSRISPGRRWTPAPARFAKAATAAGAGFPSKSRLIPFARHLLGQPLDGERPGELGRDLRRHVPHREVPARQRDPPPPERLPHGHLPPRLPPRICRSSLRRPGRFRNRSRAGLRSGDFRDTRAGLARSGFCRNRGSPRWWGPAARVRPPWSIFSAVSTT